LVRIVTGLLLAAGAWALAFKAPKAALVAMVVVLSALALHEFFGIAAKCGLNTLQVAGQTGAALWLITPNLDRGYFATLLLIALLGAAVLERVSPKELLPTAAVTLAGVVYVAGPMLCGMLLHDISPHWLVFVFVVVGVGDSVALVVGRSVGRHPLAPLASPRKTWEGTVASVVAGTLVGAWYAATFLSQDLPLLEAALLALSVNSVSQIGDVTESVLKRAAGLKDSGNILPGHGGLLDRVDGLLFAMPAAYGYLQFLH
jgi:phosphatidate cytidylyltransferase